VRVLAEEKRSWGEDGWVFITQRGTKDGTKEHEGGKEDEKWEEENINYKFFK